MNILKIDTCVRTALNNTCNLLIQATLYLYTHYFKKSGLNINIAGICSLSGAFTLYTSLSPISIFFFFRKQVKYLHFQKSNEIKGHLGIIFMTILYKDANNFADNPPISVTFAKVTTGIL